jgi:hypothetical protein
MKSNNSKSTILVIVLGFIVMHLLFAWEWAIIVSLVVGIFGISSEYISQKIEWIWYMITRVLQHILPNILLMLVFFLILFPLSILYKLFHRDLLMLSNKHNTYFVNVNKKVDKSSFEKSW